MLPDINKRIGSFLLLVGIALFLVFVLLVLAGTFRFDALIFSLLSLIIGSKLRSKSIPNPSGSRFHTIRRISSRNKSNENENDENR